MLERVKDEEMVLIWECSVEMEVLKVLKVLNDV